MNVFRATPLVAVCMLASAGVYADEPVATQRFYEVPNAKLYTETFGHGPNGGAPPH
jgi:hypothetical protein